MNSAFHLHDTALVNPIGQAGFEPGERLKSIEVEGCREFRTIGEDISSPDAQLFFS
jgi:hypothetical protein